MTDAGVDTKKTSKKVSELSATQRAHQASFDEAKFSQQRFSGLGATATLQRRVDAASETEEVISDSFFVDFDWAAAAKTRRMSASLAKVTKAMPSRFRRRLTTRSSAYRTSKLATRWR